MCGYEDRILAMLRTCDPGLARRFRVEDAFRFPDYTNEELVQIMLRMAHTEGVYVTEAVAKIAIETVLAKQRMKPNFGNAGAVRNLLQVGKARRLALSSGGKVERAASSGGVYAHRISRISPSMSSSLLASAMASLSKWARLME